MSCSFIQGYSLLEFHSMGNDEILIVMDEKSFTINMKEAEKLITWLQELKK